MKRTFSFDAKIVFLLLLLMLNSIKGSAQITVTIGSADIVNLTTSYPCPIQDWYYASRAQFLYLQPELQALGILPGTVIIEIGWIATSTTIIGHLMEGYSISLLNTATNSLTITAWEPGATLVYGPQDYSYPSGYSGPVLFTITPFYYGGGNLIVEVCGGVSTGGYTNNPQCQASSGLPFNASHQWRQDVADGCGTVDATNYATLDQRPVLVVTCIPSNFEVPMVEGDLYYDLNQNGVRDGGEIGVANHQVEINPPGYHALTDTGGHYKFYMDTASYTLNWVPKTPWTQTSSPLVYSVSVPPNSTGNDFGIWALPADVEYTQLVAYVTGIMRCNNTGHSTLQLRNTGLYPENGTVTLISSSNLPFDTSSSTPGFSQSGDSVRWTYTSLSPGQQISFQGNFHNGNAGDTVTFVYIDSVFDASWNFQHVYTNDFTFVVTCSYDPNDKAVDPAGEGLPHYTLMSEELMYTIRFQNTGNDTAFNVMIVDTMDASLDLQTFEVLASSHPVAVQISSSGEIRFRFQNILLPDSIVDEPGSHGYVVYRVKPLTGLPENTLVENTAYIFFDMNAAVVTNTAYNTLVSFIPTAIGDLSIASNGFFYPNPVTDGATIKLIGQLDKAYSLSIYNSIGAEVFSDRFSGDEYMLREKLASGFYTLRVTGTAGQLVYTTKFAVSR